MLERKLPEESNTLALGAALAIAMPADVPRALRIELRGELGAGKTTLVRGFLRACGIVGVVRSPSYALLEIYEFEGRRALHLDLYRLRDPTEVAGLGLRDYDEPGTVWLVEWPERAAGALPAPDLVIELVGQLDGHHGKLTSGSPEGLRWIRSIE